MPKGLILIALACVAVAPLVAATMPTLAGEEAEYLRLRPAKEPACASGRRGKCQLVQAPRINDRRVSTIPGIQHPDFGRPPVIVIEPIKPGSVAPFRSFGAHRGIFGGS